jgi:tetratricopeptide (TPR) repeat protein
VSFETYAAALTEDQRKVLRAATLFRAELPVPVTVLEAAGRAVGVAEAEPAVKRLLGLGLLDAWDDIDGIAHAAANPLARPLAGDEMGEAETISLAAAVIGPLMTAWRRADGRLPWDPRGLEAARLALAADADAATIDAAVLAAGAYLFKRCHDARAALAIMTMALERIEAKGGQPSAGFLNIAADAAKRLGEVETQIALLEKGLALDTADAVGQARIAVQHATATIGRDGPEAALATLHRAAETFAVSGDVYERAVTMGQIADIHQARGELDEALRIRREEELPVYERLGDVRSRAVTMGWISDIHQARGELDAALRICREEVLPVLERLGDVRSRAVTMGKIADVHQERGDLDVALRIRREEELPVYERLGDVRERAVAMGKIAAIHQARGEPDEALRIHLERLPVARAMGDIDSVAHIRYACATIRLQRGGLEGGEAQVITDELAESFAISVKLGRADFIVAVGFYFAQILAVGGHFEEALEVLDRAEQAAAKLGREERLNAIRKLRERIRQMGAAAG